MSNYDKSVKLEVAYTIIAQLDDGMETVYIDKAIEQLNNLKYVRENMPF